MLGGPDRMTLNRRRAAQAARIMCFLCMPALVLAAAQGVGAQAPKPPAKPAAPSKPPPAKPPIAPVAGIVATATVIANGRAVAILPAGCAPSAGGTALRVVASDPASGMSLLELPAKAAPLKLSPEAIVDGAALVIAGYNDTSSATAPAALNAVSGEAVVTQGAADQPRVLAPVQPPAAGSAVFDRSGRLAGLIGASGKAPRRFAGVVPMMTHPLIGLPALLKFSGIAGTASPAVAQGAETVRPRTAGEIISAAKPSLIGVECAK